MPSDNAVFSLRGSPYKRTKYGGDTLDLRKQGHNTKRQPPQMAKTLKKAPGGMRGLNLRGTILFHPEASDAPNPFAHQSPAPVKMGTKGKAKIEKVMHEYKEGPLKSSSGKKVTKKSQAVAIGMSEARRAKKGKY